MNDHKVTEDSKKNNLVHIKLSQVKSEKNIVRSLAKHNKQLGLTQQRYKKMIENIEHLTINQISENLHALTNSNISDFTLRNYQDVQYIGQINAGSNDKKMKVLFDTGSSFIWFPDRNCKSCKRSGMKNSFNCEDSTSCTRESEEYKLQYGTGKMVTKSIKDTLSEGRLKVKNQFILLIEKVQELKKFQGDGLVGMGFKSLSKNKNTFMDNLYQQNVINNKSFSIYLKSKKNLKNDFTSTIVFGGVDEKFADPTDTWKYCNVESKLYWGLQLNKIDFSLNGKVLSLSQGTRELSKNEKPLTSKFAVIDSGTSILTLDEHDFKYFESFMAELDLGCFKTRQIPLLGCWETRKHKFPIITFHLCNNSYDLNPEEYLVCDSNSCFILIQKLRFPITILGNVFMRIYYTHFDMNSVPARIGFKKSVS